LAPESGRSTVNGIRDLSLPLEEKTAENIVAIPIPQDLYSDYAGVQEVAGFPIRVPQKIPAGFSSAKFNI
jgi:hypothetical protein